LSISKEDDEEHDGKPKDVFSTSTQSGGQLCHGLIKADVLENLQMERRRHMFLGTARDRRGKGKDVSALP